MDPLTIALIGGGISAAGSLLKGIFGAKAEERKIEAMREMFREQMEFFQETTREARERVGRRISDYIQTIWGEERRVGEAGRRAEELLAGGFTEFRSGLRAALEEFQKETGIAIEEARERVGREYDIAMQLAEHLARGEIQRRMEALGFGAGAGATALMQQRAVMQALLPLITQKAETVAGLERQILSLRERGAERGLAVRSELAESMLEEARARGEIGLRVAGKIAEMGIRGMGKALAQERALEQAILAGARTLEFPAGAFMRTGAELYGRELAGALEQIGMGLAMAGMGGGGGKG